LRGLDSVGWLLHWKEVSKAAVFGVLGWCTTVVLAGGGVVGQEKISRVRLIAKRGLKGDSSLSLCAAFYSRHPAISMVGTSIRLIRAIFRMFFALHDEHRAT
jgi:hypothetical protein